MKKISALLLMLTIITVSVFAQEIKINEIGTINIKQATIKEITREIEKDEEEKAIFFIPHANKAIEILLTQEPFEKAKFINETKDEKNIYKIKTEKITGTYTTTLLTKEIIQEKEIKKLKQRQLYSKTNEEKQKEIDEKLKKQKIKDFKIKIIENSYWQENKNGKGKTYQTLKARIIIEEGFEKYPLWINANVFKTKSGYKILLFSGSHIAATYMDPVIQEAMYNIKE